MLPVNPIISFSTFVCNNPIDIATGLIIAHHPQFNRPLPNFRSHLNVMFLQKIVVTVTDIRGVNRTAT
jgi:hypothetical protein